MIGIASYTAADRTKLLMANLQLAEPVVSARIRVYKPGVPTAEELMPREAAKREDFGNNSIVPYIHPDTEVIPGPQPVYTYYDGRDLNERIHQQDDNFRSFVTRRVQPGGTYYLRVEANQPGYELEVRLVDPAPFRHTAKSVETVDLLPPSGGRRLADSTGPAISRFTSAFVTAPACSARTA